MRWVPVFVMLFLAAVANAEGPTETVQLTVTSASGNSVFVDQGRARGLATGLRVRFFPPGSAPVEGIVRVVSTNSARVDLLAGLAVPPVGTRGEVEVPVVEPQGLLETEPEAVTPASEVPEHPPWSAEVPEDVAAVPLLAPVGGLRPAERPREIDGRVYVNVLESRDDARGRDNRYVTARPGIDLEVRNPLGHGGRLQFAGEVDHRSAFLADAPDTDDTTARLDLLSYAVGGEAYAPYRLEGGRFRPVALPELGLLDGAEAAAQFDNGVRIGVGGGAYPLPFSERRFGEDTGFHAFADYQSDTPGGPSAALGYQKTWHEGERDRDQVLARLRAPLRDGLTFHSSVRIDVYTADDEIKGRGVELTEWWTQARYSPTGAHGVAVSYSGTRWPELKRAEFRDLPPPLVRDGRVDRGNASAWVSPAKTLRLSGRVDAWEDQDNSGTGGELAADWRAADRRIPSLHAAAFVTDGAANAGHGARIEARHDRGPWSGMLGYEWFQYDVGSALGPDAEVVRQLGRAELAWARGGWYYSLTGDVYFGDLEDSVTVGLYAVYRF